MPLGKNVVVICKGGNGDATVSDRVRSAKPIVLSVTRTEKVKVPLVLGFPASVPSGYRFRPPGKGWEPGERDQLKGWLHPDA